MNDKNKIYKKILAENIKTRRNELGISKKQLSDRCFFDKNYINLLETSKVDPSFLDLKILSKGLEFSLSELLKGL